MKQNEHSPIHSLLTERANLSEIIIIAIFLGFGISLTISSVSLFKNFNPVVGLLIGVMICLISLGYLTLRIFIRRKRYLFEGFFILNENDNELIDIPGYEFVEHVHEFFETAFTENKALRHLWDTDPLKLQDELKEPEPHSVAIIRESIEYFLLDKLFSHLITYFEYPKKHSKKITVLEREQIPNILLKNRFLELFSKPMHDREHFIGIEDSLRQDDELFVLDVNGAVFRKFLLVLPHKSRVQRINSSQICIETKRFLIDMEVEFDRTNTNLPRGYLEYYLGIYGYEEYLTNVVYDVKIHIQVNFKIRAFFTPSGWEDFKWIDSFMQSLNQSFSKDQYFKEINWNTAYTVLQGLVKNDRK